MKRSIAVVVVLIAIYAVAPSRSYASYSVNSVSVKELGLKFVARASGPSHVRVELELKPEGKFKQFGLVEMRLSEGDKPVLMVPLKETKAESGEVKVSFTASRDQLKHLSMWVLVQDSLAGGTAYTLELDEFVDLEKLE